MGDLIDNMYDATCEYIERNKSMIGFIIMSIILAFIFQCCFGKEECSDSIINMNDIHKACYDGAKLKFVNNQWICSCEK